MQFKIEQGSEKINSVDGLSLLGLLLDQSNLRNHVGSSNLGTRNELERKADVFSSVVGL